MGKFFTWLVNFALNCMPKPTKRCAKSVLFNMEVKACGVCGRLTALYQKRYMLSLKCIKRLAITQLLKNNERGFLLGLFTGFNQINVRRSTLDKDCLISGRHRRKRAKYTKKQLIKLELEFERNPYPNSWERESLAQQLGINETRIQVWFSNRRAKGRRERFGDEGTQRKAIPAQVCTCHTYCKPLRAPWMMETGFPTLFFPAAGYWT